MVQIGFGPWWRHPDIRLKENKKGELLLVGVGEPEKTRVFDDEPLRLPNPREQRGKESRRSWRARSSHALAFASIETPEHALLFAKRYGLLGIAKSPQLKKLPSPGSREWIRQLVANQFESRVNFLGPPPSEAEQVTLWLMWANELRTILDYVREEWAKDPEGALQWAGEWLDNLVYTGWGAPRFRLLNGRAVLEYHTLLSALFTQALMEITNADRAPTRCQGPGCTIWFFPTDPRSIYCSEECRRSAQNARLYRKRRSQTKEAKRRVEEAKRPE